MASNHSSQRSRVKGTLELYHAYISDSPNIENDNGDVSDSGGWELVQPENNSPVEQAAEVCNRLYQSCTILIDKIYFFAFL